MPKIISKKPVTIALENRITSLKPHLPKGWRKILCEEYPEYDTMKGQHKVSNVMSLHSTDLELTERLEKLFPNQVITNQE